MNNAKIILEEVEDLKPQFREQIDTLTETLEALNRLAESNYWKVLKQNIFDVDLRKVRSRLTKSSNTTEIFRLQGQIEWGEKFSLEKLIKKYRDELQIIKNKLHE